MFQGHNPDGARRNGQLNRENLESKAAIRIWRSRRLTWMRSHSVQSIAVPPQSLLDMISSYFRLTRLCRIVLIGSGTTRPDAGKSLDTPWDGPVACGP